MRKAWREDIRYRKKHRMNITPDTTSNPLQGLDFSGLKGIQERIYDIAYTHGWYAEDRTFGDRIALCHSELSEALEEFRNGHHLTEVYYEHSNECKTQSFQCICNPKPEGVPIELADVIIRLMDMAEADGIDLADAIAIKVRYNATRPFRHGGKAL